MMRRSVVDAVLHDDDWNHRARAETPVQRLDRNWTDLLQELRVLQTGVQILTGFLLILPFQSRFSALSMFQGTVYGIAMSLAVAATGCLLAPVSLHRILFRRHARRIMVHTAHQLVLVGLTLLGAAVLATVLLVFNMTGGVAVGWVAAAAASALLAGLWLALPWWVRAGLRGEATSAPRQAGSPTLVALHRPR